MLGSFIAAKAPALQPNSFRISVERGSLSTFETRRIGTYVPMAAIRTGVVACVFRSDPYRKPCRAKRTLPSYLALARKRSLVKISEERVPVGAKWARIAPLDVGQPNVIEEGPTLSETRERRISMTQDS